MSKHYKSQYYTKANGTVVMSFAVFKKIKHEQICKLLGIRTNS